MCAGLRPRAPDPVARTAERNGAYRNHFGAVFSEQSFRSNLFGAVFSEQSFSEQLMPSAMWTGYLTFGLISMPVRLFSGARGSRVSFHMLHRDDHARIKMQMWCPQDERVVERSEIVKGYEYRKGEYVVVEPDDIKKIEPKTAKAMEILEFVKADEIDPIYFETSYYLMPEEAGKRPYALLAQAMEETGHLAVRS